MNNSTDRTALVAYIKQQQAAHKTRFDDFYRWTTYYRGVLTAIITRFPHCSMSQEEASALVFDDAMPWLRSLAPVKEWDKKTGEPTEYYGMSLETHLLDSLTEWFVICEGNKRAEDTLAAIALPDDPSLTATEVRPLLWNFLYAANERDLESSIRPVCEWLLQCKGNLREENHHHHPLLYVSRDREDGSKKGGNGKSFICEALVDELSSRGLPCQRASDNSALPAARSEFISDAYSKNILVSLSELPSIHQINQSAVRSIFEDGYYSVRKMRKDPYSAKVTSMFIGTTNYQDWFSADPALAARLHIVNINADLNFRDKELREACNASHPLPTKKDIADAFLKLLTVPDSVFEEIIKECESSDEDIATDLDEYQFSKLLRHLEINCSQSPNGILPITIRDELKSFVNDRRKWGSLTQKVANAILNRHFGKKGVQYFHGKHLHEPLDLRSLSKYKAPDFDSRLTPLEAYNKVWEVLHRSGTLPTDPDDFESKKSDETPKEETKRENSIPQPNVFFDAQCSKPIWAGSQRNDIRDDYQFESLNPIDPEKAKESVESGESKTGCKDSTVSSMRNFVFECDDVSLDWQKSIAMQKKGVINRAVCSGGKSIHCRVTIDFEPKDIEEYKRIWHLLNEKLFDGNADKACANPSRKTRHPNGFRFDKETTQEVLFDIPDCVFPLSKYEQYMRRIREMEELDDLDSYAPAERAGGRRGDGSRLETPKVREFLGTRFAPGVKHGGAAHSGFYKAVLSCKSGDDATTLDMVLTKARMEGWREPEIRSTMRNAEKWLARHADE